MRLPTRCWVWLIFGLRSRRSPCRCVAPEGSAPLSAAVPTRRSSIATAEGDRCMARVFIGVDPHKLSATIEVVDDKETVLATGRFATDKAGHAAMRKHVAAYPEHIWAVEGSNGAGRPWRSDCWPTASTSSTSRQSSRARARALDTGHNRKTDPHDAHAVAMVAVRTPALRVLAYDAPLEALRSLVDRRAELSRARIQTVNRVPSRNSFRDSQSGTSPPARPRRSSRRSSPATWPARPAAGSPPSRSPSSSRSRRRPRRSPAS